MYRFILLLICLFSGPNAIAQYPLPDYEDRVRIAEAFHLADSVQESIWPGWSEVPFVLLLVTPEFEYLFRHPYPSEGFINLGADKVSGETIYARPNTGSYSTGFLATFPAVNGVNTVVIGQAENTGKSSTLWTITALHEHFHQMQFSRPWYYEAVRNLDLADGDESGMWQLNYPFPYDSPDVARSFDALRHALSCSTGEKDCDYEQIAAAHKDLKDQLDEADYRYLSFQLWQEGVARYTEYAVAEAADKLHTPLAEFQKLEDYMPYSEAWQLLLDQQKSDMENFKLSEWQRVAFYPLGAAQAMMQDTRREPWKENYFKPPFFQIAD